MARTMNVGAVGKVGEEIEIKGWVNMRRNMGKIVFLDMRDRSGILQVVCVPNEILEGKELVEEIRHEFVLHIKGVVQARTGKQINPDMPTGTVELLAKSITILNTAKTPPFEVNKDTTPITEDLRLKYRYLDLRSSRMLKNLVLRDAVATFFRHFLHERGFIEVETPYLTKGTPEGSREFLVPSRLHDGQFYVLPQSPQQFKQLLMVAGVEKYFQVARCFRDEDQRGDRQPEFTQLDLEMSFVEREDVMSLIEEMMVAMIKAVAPEKKIQQVPFPRFSYEEVMKKYGTDKPDLRKDKNDPDELALCWVIDFPFFEKTDDGAWTFTHNPFSAPKPEHKEWLMNKTNIGEILTTQYDMVMNGYEVWGGSIRNHEPEALHRVFEIMGFTDEEIQSQFGHMIEAFNFGAPPHGGIASGQDRIVMVLANEPNIREVIPMPKTGDARDLMMDAPSPINKDRLDEAHIQVKK